MSMAIVANRNSIKISTPTVISTEDKIMTHFGQSLHHTGMESPECILAGTSHGHRCTHSSTVQIQLKMWIKFTHPHPSACQTLALQWLCYQALHSRRHVKRQTNSIFLCLHKKSSYCFPQPLMIHLKLISTGPTATKGFWGHFWR